MPLSPSPIIYFVEDSFFHAGKRTPRQGTIPELSKSHSFLVPMSAAKNDSNLRFPTGHMIIYYDLIIFIRLQLRPNRVVPWFAFRINVNNLTVTFVLEQ